MTETRPYRFCLVNLGCPKNTVDSEGVLGALALAGFHFVPEPDDADICLVNTCGFLEEAREESADILEELAEMKDSRGRPLLVALGCLVERAGKTPALDIFLKHADARVGFADYARLPHICLSLLDKHKDLSRATEGFQGKALPPSYFSFLNQPRMRIGSPASAYLKLGEGCSNGCAYCSIPLIRGRLASRSIRDIMGEARQLVASGARELNLIAQDTSAYGMDRARRSQLPNLLRELGSLPDELWFRILYAHPRHLTDEILGAMAADPRVCPYVDLPLQHIHDGMLKTMRRGYGRQQVEDLLPRIRAALPGAAIRTTFIVGHPGEGRAEFQELLDFVKAGHLDHMGVFVWSPEPDTASTGMENRVPVRTARSRRDALMRAQARVAGQRWQGRVGLQTEVLLERREGDGWRGRTMWQAPEVDDETIVSHIPAPARIGDVVPVVIEKAQAYDLWARGISP